MKTITIVDTSMSTDNLGDEIIMDAVNSVVWELFPDSYIFRVPSHEALSDRTLRWIRQSDLCFIGGTNILSSKIRPRGLWRLRESDADHYAATETICLGTGWNDYMPAATPETKRILTRALAPRFAHSARDSYTAKHLEDLDITAVNTSCPTTWQLTPDHCGRVRTSKSSKAIFTLSAWRPDVEADRAFMELLCRKYDGVYFFPQMQDDIAYFRSFNMPAIRSISPTTEYYTKFLEDNEVDFVGTRLHGGIRALQKYQRALILAIDNRAKEISKDTGLPTADRGDLPAIERWIEDEPGVKMRIPIDRIQAWKAQFTGTALEERIRQKPDLDALEKQAKKSGSLVGRIKQLAG